MKSTFSLELALFLIVCILLSACGQAPVEATQFEVTNVQTGQQVPTGTDAGGSTEIVPDLPNEKALSEFVACQYAALHGNVEKLTKNVTFTNGETKPATLVGCDGSNYDGPSMLVSATTVAMLPVDATVLAWVCIIGVGIYALVGLASYAEGNGISVSISQGSNYTPAQLPTFASFNLGQVTVYTSYVATDRTAFTFNTYGEIPDTVETVYLYENGLSEDSTMLGFFSTSDLNLYATTTQDTSKSAYWTVSVAEWYEVVNYARLASQDAGAVALPPIVWPKWDPEQSGWQHAAKSRNWPIQGIMLAYEAIAHTGDNVYFSPALKYVLITTYDPFVGTIGSIFTIEQDIVGALTAGTLNTIVPLNPVTIIFPIHGTIEAKRVRGCFSYQVWQPTPQPFNVIYEPMEYGTGGKGTCLQMNQNNTGAFNQ